MTPQPEHELQAGLPQISQSCSASDDEAGAEADAVDEAPSSIAPTNPRADADAAEGGGGEGVDNDGNVAEFEGPVAALGGVPSFFFVMGWFVGLLEVR